jgi:phospholipid-translocating ATPase
MCFHQNIALTADQMLLRGTKLRHTEWVIGLVINTGLDTKIEQNATPPPHKQSRVELSMTYSHSEYYFCFSV